MCQSAGATGNFLEIQDFPVQRPCDILFSPSLSPFTIIFFIHVMSDEGIRAPARKLDEFEELVYEYTSRMGLGNEEVRQQHRIPPKSWRNYLMSLFDVLMHHARTCELTSSSTGMSTRATATSASSPQPAGPQPESPSY